MGSRGSAILWVTLFVLSLDPTAVEGQQRKQAATDPSQADADFAFLGEFVGCVSRQGQMGLQVIPLGAGKFTATAYRGGLPGNGWDRATRFKLQGVSAGEVLHLTSHRMSISIQGVHATATGPHGEWLGRLRKMVRRSRTLGKRPPAGAIVLFDGRDTSAFKNARVKNGLLQIGAELTPRFRDYHLHLEFMVPYMPYARSQGRGNSGVYLQSRYEVQILDSFGLEGKFNECGALYRYRAPDQNMAFPALTWQTYDLTFRAPRFDARGQKLRNAQITVLHNGVAVHDCVQLERKTGAGRAEGPNLLPTKLQDHGDPVQFRNVWILHRSPRASAMNRWASR